MPTYPTEKNYFKKVAAIDRPTLQF